MLSQLIIEVYYGVIKNWQIVNLVLNPYRRKKITEILRQNCRAVARPWRQSSEWERIYSGKNLWKRYEDSVTVIIIIIIIIIVIIIVIHLCDVRENVTLSVYTVYVCTGDSDM